MIQAKLERTFDEATGSIIVQKFQSLPPKTKKRVEVASNIFDVLGNLLAFNSQKAAKTALKCCTSTYLKARQHAILFGPGCPRPNSKRKRTFPIKRILFELDAFAENQVALRISSFQSTSTGAPVSYLTDTVSALWRSYKAVHLNRIGRTMFFKYFAQDRFQRMNLLGGLCSVCDSTAYTLRKGVIQLSRRFCPTEENRFLRIIDEWIRHIRLLMLPTTLHLSCNSHCYAYAMQHGCVEEHNLECVDCLSIFEMINELRPLILVETENDLFWVIFQDLSRQVRAFISHRLRTASTKHIHSNVLESIGENHCLIILDFKQKSEGLVREKCVCLTAWCSASYKSNRGTKSGTPSPKCRVDRSLSQAEIGRAH